MRNIDIVDMLEGMVINEDWIHDPRLFIHVDRNRWRIEHANVAIESPVAGPLVRMRVDHGWFTMRREDVEAMLSGGSVRNTFRPNHDDWYTNVVYLTRDQDANGDGDRQ